MTRDKVSHTSHISVQYRSKERSRRRGALSCPVVIPRYSTPHYNSIFLRISTSSQKTLQQCTVPDTVDYHTGHFSPFVVIFQYSMLYATAQNGDIIQNRNIIQNWTAGAGRQFHPWAPKIKFYLHLMCTRKHASTTRTNI